MIDIPSAVAVAAVAAARALLIAGLTVAHCEGSLDQETKNKKGNIDITNDDMMDRYTQNMHACNCCTAALLLSLLASTSARFARRQRPALIQIRGPGIASRLNRLGWADSGVESHCSAKERLRTRERGTAGRE
jgi:hypothetical protein